MVGCHPQPSVCFFQRKKKRESKHLKAHQVSLSLSGYYYRYYYSLPPSHCRLVSLCKINSKRFITLNQTGSVKMSWKSEEFTSTELQTNPSILFWTKSNQVKSFVFIFVGFLFLFFFKENYLRLSFNRTRLDGYKTLTHWHEKETHTLTYTHAPRAAGK